MTVRSPQLASTEKPTVIIITQSMLNVNKYDFGNYVLSGKAGLLIYTILKTTDMLLYRGSKGIRQERIAEITINV